jgi:hypothetical protein
MRFDTTLCDKVCQWLVAGQWFSVCTLVSSTNKTDSYNINELLLKVALNTINQPTIMWFNGIFGSVCHNCHNL